jgi:hypothetical protein
VFGFFLVSVRLTGGEWMKRLKSFVTHAIGKEEEIVFQLTFKRPGMIIAFSGV